MNTVIENKSITQCECHKATPTYPTFREHFHIEGCSFYKPYMKAIEYQQVAALVCQQIDLLALMADSPNLKEQVLLAKADKDEIISNPSKRESQYKACLQVFTLSGLIK